MKIAVFLPNWLGDVAMATPTLRALRRHFGPQARMVGILRPYLADVLAGTGWLDEQWFFDPRADDRSLRSRAVARRMRAEAFDLAVLLTNSLRTAWVAWLGGAKQRIGYVRYGRGPLLTGKLYPRRVGRRLVPDADGRNVPGIGPRARLRRRIAAAGTGHAPADEQSADGVFGRLGLRGDGRVAALNSSGAYGGSKLWPVEYFGELARRIVGELDHDVLVICGPKERDIAREIVRLAGRPSRVLDGRPADGPGHGQGVHPPLPAGWFRPTAGRGTSPPRWACRWSRSSARCCPSGARTPRSGPSTSCSIWTASAATSGSARWGIIAACAT